MGINWPGNDINPDTAATWDKVRFKTAYSKIALLEKMLLRCYIVDAIFLIIFSDTHSLLPYNMILVFNPT